MKPRPHVIVFDVNETLSDMSPMGDRFAEIGAPADLAKLWFATLLRDGFALSAAGDNRRFADIGAAVLRDLLARLPVHRDVDSAVGHVMAAMSGLGLHPDVPAGIRALKEAGYRLITLSNGSATIAEELLAPAGIRDAFEALLSVEEATTWKPGAASYAYAAGACGVEREEMMLVAVHPWDIHGAARAGLATAWINRDPGTYPAHFTPPDLSVESLEQLVEALAEPGRQ